jgi:ParB family transcriptional regulator, chromosome partitioning protein
MAADSKRRGLGRGLSALLGDDVSQAPEHDPAPSATTRVPVELLYPGRFQPRRHMADAALEDLARSIAEKGILQPILVRRHPDDSNSYEIIAGERRWRAAQMVQVHDVPVVIRDLSDREALEIGLIENLQRQDLSPLEEAEGYKRLLDEFAHTQDDLARSVSKSRSHVANMMRLLGLPDPVKEMLDSGQLSAGHARALIGTSDPSALAEKVVKRGLNVRQTEHLAKMDNNGRVTAARPAEKDADTIALERDLGNLLGLAVEIKLRRNGGSLVLNYSSLEQLDDILHRLSHGRHGRDGGRDDGSHGDLSGGNGGVMVEFAPRRWREPDLPDPDGEEDRG